MGTINNEIMKKVNVISINDDTAQEQFRYKGTYLHGELEDEIGYDIFAFDRPTYFEYGATEVLIEESGRIATFLLWSNEGSSQYRGYLIYNDDEDFERCRMKFENNDANI